MKKLNKLFMLIATIIPLTSCNVGWGVGNLNFTKVHINFAGYNKCVEIEKWYDNDMGIEVKTKNYGSLYLSEGTYILVEDECPICGK